MVQNENESDETEEEDDLVEERRSAEIDFVSAAYEPREAWCDTTNDAVEGGGSSWIVNRRLQLQAATSNVDGHGENDCINETSASVILHMLMPAQYPAQAALEITGHVEDDRCTTNHRLVVKKAHDALPKLLEVCREVANSMIGEEAIFAVLGRADEWIQHDWPRALLSTSKGATSAQQSTTTLEIASPGAAPVLTRLLIYSHHIISKKKRSDMKHLANNKYHLTGYMKIGWPGLLIVEGLNSACHDFYDEIRRWNWKYLVVRGEMQESPDSAATGDPGGGGDEYSDAVLLLLVQLDRLNALRRFEKLVEVDDMSVVAAACREAGLEDLFRTSIKVYTNTTDRDEGSALLDSSATPEQVTPYGVLAHVDHMNDAKGYAKWLCKNCSELDVCLAMKQLQEDEQHATIGSRSNNISVGRRTNIIVCLVGEKADVSSLFKRWRTSRVDVDARGKPCLERMLTVLVEGFLERAPSSRIDWEQHQQQQQQQQQPFQVNSNEDAIATSSNRYTCNKNPSTIDLVRAIGGQIWVDALQTLYPSTAAR